MFRIFLIKFCSKRALVFDAILKMLLEKDHEEFKFVYAIGVASINKEKWLKRIEKLQPKS